MSQNVYICGKFLIHIYLIHTIIKLFNNKIESIISVEKSHTKMWLIISHDKKELKKEPKIEMQISRW